MDLETQMIQAARKGQAQGYKFLMNRYGRPMQLLVAQWVTDMRDVEELTQDVFVRAFEHLSDFDPERASFSTWLSRIPQLIAPSELILKLEREGVPKSTILSVADPPAYWLSM